jgi:thioredoxin reductase
VCFDEHQETLPSDATDVANRPIPRTSSRGIDRSPASSTPTPKIGGKGSVCEDQHFPDRAEAWEAAREAAARVPWVGPGAGKASALNWLGIGGLAAAIGYAGSRGATALRRKKKPKVSASTVKAAERTRLPVIDTSTCLGCYACVDVCPYGVLEVERYVAVVARPDACCGLVLCEQKCPNGSLKVTEGEVIADRPRIHDSLESRDVPGLYLAGDITGLPLIKNAILQGAHAVTEAVAALAKRPKPADTSVLDLCIVGAGPSGISAALRAKELGARYAVLEQGNVAASIRSFPRGKLVFDQPLELPVSGALWLKESTKEELLLHWMRIVRREKLEVREGERVAAIDRGPDGIFSVTSVPTEGKSPAVIRSRAVLIAIGRRGTPRKLPFPISGDAENRVHYHLADARSFAGSRILIAGLGDTAMEAAIALAAAGGHAKGRPGDGDSGISVTMIYRGATYSRGQTRNIEEIERLRAAGRLTVLFETEITEISSRADASSKENEPSSGVATVRAHSNGREKQIPFDALFVLIGNIAPWDTIRGSPRRDRDVVGRCDRLHGDASRRIPHADRCRADSCANRCFDLGQR